VKEFGKKIHTKNVNQWYTKEVVVAKVELGILE
jgi:hypothetical protein